MYGFFWDFNLPPLLLMGTHMRNVHGKKYMGLKDGDEYEEHIAQHMRMKDTNSTNVWIIWDFTLPPVA